MTCPRCGDVLFLENRWNCGAKRDALQFTLKTGSIIEFGLRLGWSQARRFPATLKRTNPHRRQSSEYAHIEARQDHRYWGKTQASPMGILERGTDGIVRTVAVSNRKKTALQAEERERAEVGSALHTDALKSYEGLNEFEHQVVDHAVQCVEVPDQRHVTSRRAEEVDSIEQGTENEFIP
jgi:hypothetical protein